MQQGSRNVTRAAGRPASEGAKMDEQRVSVQTWQVGGPYWRTDENRSVLPPRASLIGGSWQRTAGANSPRR
jgi:hypothetical protein